MVKTSREDRPKKAEKPVSKMNGNSHSPQRELPAILRSQCPEVFTEGKIDVGKLKQTLGEELDTNNERYGLSWAGKNECFRHIQETTTATLKPCREESVDFDTTENIFIEGDNLEILKILQKTYQNKIKMIYIDPPYNTGNDSFIYPDRFKEEKGDYEQRAGIKDAEGLLTKDGFWRKNSKDAGHFHSNWLSMMYPRLFLAKNLLREDGVIFVSIDDNEVQNLRMIMNEVFGEENFVTSIIWEKKFAPQNDAKWFSDNHDFILAYARNKEIWRPKLLPRTEQSKARYGNPDNDPRGPWTSADLTVKTYSEKYDYPITTPTGKKIEPTAGRCWSMPKESVQKLIKEGRIWFGKDGNNVPRVKMFLSDVKDGIVPLTIWKHSSVGHNQGGRQELKKLFGDVAAFDGPKPSTLIRQMLILSTNTGDEDIVLDFFAGSCTTAHSVMQLNAEDGGNRKFICVQLAVPCEQESEAFKAGFKTIADIGKERIRRAGKKIKKEVDAQIASYKKNPKLFEDENQKSKIENLKSLDLGFKVFRLEQSNFKQWRENIKEPAEFKKQLWDMVENVKKGAASEDMLFEIILKNSRFDLNVAAEKRNYDGVEYYVLATHSTSSGQAPVTEKEKVRHGLTQISTDFEIVCLDLKVTKKFVDKVLAEKPQRFTCLDAAFKNNDQIKTNTALQMENAKIEFKVI